MMSPCAGTLTGFSVTATNGLIEKHPTMVAQHTIATKTGEEAAKEAAHEREKALGSIDFLKKSKRAHDVVDSKGHVIGPFAEPPAHGATVNQNFVQTALDPRCKCVAVACGSVFLQRHRPDARNWPLRQEGIPRRLKLLTVLAHLNLSGSSIGLPWDILVF